MHFASLFWETYPIPCGNLPAPPVIPSHQFKSISPPISHRNFPWSSQGFSKSPVLMVTKKSPVAVVFVDHSSWFFPLVASPLFGPKSRNDPQLHRGSAANIEDIHFGAIEAAAVDGKWPARDPGMTPTISSAA